MRHPQKPLNPIKKGFFLKQENFVFSGEVGGPRLGSPGHPHQVAEVLHGLGGSLQVPLYGPASDRPIAG